MRQIIMVLASILLLAGCVVNENRIEEPHMNTEKLKTNADKLLEKQTDIPIVFENDYFELFHLQVGDEKEAVILTLGEPLQEKTVENDWRIDEILSYKVDDVQVDIALYKGKIDEIALTLKNPKRYAWGQFKNTFNGLIYEATDEFLATQEETGNILYFVNETKDQWLVVQEKEDGSVLLSNTYTYDLSILKENESVIEQTSSVE